MKNIGDRHRLNGQRDVYLQKNPDDANLNENELCKIVADNDPELNFFKIVCKRTIQIL